VLRLSARSPGRGVQKVQRMNSSFSRS